MMTRDRADFIAKLLQQNVPLEKSTIHELVEHAKATTTATPEEAESMDLAVKQALTSERKRACSDPFATHVKVYATNSKATCSACGWVGPERAFGDTHESIQAAMAESGGDATAHRRESP